MIEIKRKEDCVGCHACAQICPKQCISMNTDEQGFLYPHVDILRCIECGLCEKACPVLNQSEPHEPLSAYAAKNTDLSIQRSSSSGGVFYTLAKSVIEDGGVVFGARFNKDWEVIHDFTESFEGIQLFQTSKYVQSRIGETYRQAEKFLKQGRKVLFSGTPCQIAGLRLFLRKNYETLLAVDIVCHGVPSPLVWKKYLDFIIHQGKILTDLDGNMKNNQFSEKQIISNISFRDKRFGWEKYGLYINYAAPMCNPTPSSCVERGEVCFFEPHNDNLFMRCFIKDLFLRPSCYECPAKSGKSGSDLTLADFWGIKASYPQLYDEAGVSLVLINSQIGKNFLNTPKRILSERVESKIALERNTSYYRNANRPQSYSKFWELFQKNGFEEIPHLLNQLRPSFIERTIRKIKSILFSVTQK